MQNLLTNGWQDKLTHSVQIRCVTKMCLSQRSLRLSQALLLQTEVKIILYSMYSVSFTTLFF